MSNRSSHDIAQSDSESTPYTATDPIFMAPSLGSEPQLPLTDSFTSAPEPKSDLSPSLAVIVSLLILVALGISLFAINTRAKTPKGAVALTGLESQMLTVLRTRQRGINNARQRRASEYQNAIAQINADYQRDDATFNAQQATLQTDALSFLSVVYDAHNLTGSCRVDLEGPYVLCASKEGN